ncbi:MAG: P-loop NTPase, partial [Gemmatimonadetes bacterium]|nr:P-loop NTPase [Gemmatimonadota bacterium]
KTLVSSALALALADSGRRCGLLDLDFTGPCAHLVLGVDQAFPEEDAGILPQTVSGVGFMSIACFAGADPAPLRGIDMTNALIELLAITRWGELDTLVIDMPPGLGDMALDTVRLLPTAEYLVVANGARLVTKTVERSLSLLHRLGLPVCGIVENMSATSGQAAATVSALATEYDTPMLGVLPYDEAIEDRLGSGSTLLHTRFGRAVRDLASLLSQAGAGNR